MDPVGAGEERDVGAIVDDGARVPACDRDQALCASEKGARVERFLAKLHAIGAGFHRELCDALPGVMEA